MRLGWMSTLALFVAPLAAPDDPNASHNDRPRVVIRGGVDLVQIDVIVTDKKGHHVTGLSIDDFDVLEGGHRKALAHCQYVSLVPGPSAVHSKMADPSTRTPRLTAESVKRTMVLVVDDAGLSFESGTRVREAMTRLVDENAQPDDLIAIARTGYGTHALQPFTTDKQLLRAAIEALGRKPSSEIIPNTPDIGVEMLGATPDGMLQKQRFEMERVLRYRSIDGLESLVSALASMPGRRSLVLFSDRFAVLDYTGLWGPDGPPPDGELLGRLRRITDLANRAAITIYAVASQGLPTFAVQANNSRTSFRGPFGHETNLAGLGTLANETGGLLFKNDNDLVAILSTVSADQSGYYLLGYDPQDLAPESGKSATRLKKLEVRVQRSGLKVRLRAKGFRPSDLKDAATQWQSTADPRLAVALSPFAATQLHVRSTTLFGQDGPSPPVLRCLIHVLSDGLTLSQSDSPDAALLRFDVTLVLFAPGGVPLLSYSRAPTVTIPGPHIPNAEKHGVVFEVSAPAPAPGLYEVKTILRDTVSGRIGSSSGVLHVPDLSSNTLTLSGLIMAGPTYAGAIDGFAADVRDTPAVRHFRAGAPLSCALVAYNAHLDRATRRPQLEVQAHLTRGPDRIELGPPTVVDSLVSMDSTSDSRGAFAMSTQFVLPVSLPSGAYVLHLSVYDRTVESAREAAERQIDFQVFSP